MGEVIPFPTTFENMSEETDFTTTFEEQYLDDFTTSVTALTEAWTEADLRSRMDDIREQVNSWPT